MGSRARKRKAKCLFPRGSAPSNVTLLFGLRFCPLFTCFYSNARGRGATRTRTLASMIFGDPPGDRCLRNDILAHVFFLSSRLERLARDFCGLSRGARLVLLKLECWMVAGGPGSVSWVVASGMDDFG